MPYQCLWHRSVYSIHRHVVAVVSSPSECQFAEVASPHDEAVHLISCVHEDLRSFASLSILVGRVVLLHVVPDVVEVLDASFLDAYLTNGDAEQFHEVDGVGIGAVCRAEARHSDAHNTTAILAQPIKCTDTNQQGKRRVKASAYAQNNGLRTSMLQSLC